MILGSALANIQAYWSKDLIAQNFIVLGKIMQVRFLGSCVHWSKKPGICA